MILHLISYKKTRRLLNKNTKCVKTILPARSNNWSAILFFASIIVWFNAARNVSVKLTKITKLQPHSGRSF